MHAPTLRVAVVRPLAAMVLVFMMLVPSVWTAVAPAGGQVIGSVADGELPLEWLMGAGDSALFNVTSRSGERKGNLTSLN